jgi:predicted CoA-binding protein
MINPETLLRDSTTYAVLGVNTDHESYANKILRKLHHVKKTAYGVNPKYDTLFNQPVYEDLEKLPQVPEVVVFVVNPTIGITYLDRMAELGIKYAWLQPGTISIELLERAKALGIEPIEACVLVVSAYL